MRKRTLNRTGGLTPTARRCAGLTLMEVVVSTLLVGLLLIATMRAVGGVFRTRSEGAQITNGYLLAEDLMAEILQSPYEDPDGSPDFGVEFVEGGSGRTSFDDVDDYHNWSKSPPEDRNGTAIPGAAGWTRAVAVTWVDPTDPQIEPGVDKGLKRIVVTVTSPEGRTFKLNALRSSAGLMELKPPTGETYIVGGTARYQVGDAVNSRRSGTAISNHAQDD